MSNIKVRVGQQNSVKVVSNVSGSLNLVNGITILNNNNLVGVARSTFKLNFVGSGVSIAPRIGNSDTVDILITAGFADVSSSVIGGIASVTTLSVSGISTLGNIGINSNTISSLTGDLILESNSSNVSINSNLNITGFLSATDGIYYQSGDYFPPNGIAYFDQNGKLMSSKDTSYAINDSNYLLTTNNSGEPVWANVLDGGQY